MGTNFKFKEWCDQWLKTSGVNTLEPQVVLNQNMSLSSLSITQLVDAAGQNRLRKSKIDIGVYDQNYNLHLIQDFVLSDTNSTNVVTADLLK